MKIRIAQRAISLALAVVLTAGMFGAIDHLAGAGEASAVWAAAVTAPRG